jgi:hypothetical protein
MSEQALASGRSKSIAKRRVPYRRNVCLFRIRIVLPQLVIFDFEAARSIHPGFLVPPKPRRNAIHRVAGERAYRPRTTSHRGPSYRPTEKKYDDFQEYPGVVQNTPAEASKYRRPRLSFVLRTLLDWAQWTPRRITIWTDSGPRQDAKSASFGVKPFHSLRRSECRAVATRQLLILKGLSNTDYYEEAPKRWTNKGRPHRSVGRRQGLPHRAVR